MPPVSEGIRNRNTTAMQTYLSQNIWRQQTTVTTAQFNHLRSHTATVHYIDDQLTPPFIPPHIYRNATAADLFHHYTEDLISENLLMVAAEFPIVAVQAKINAHGRKGKDGVVKRIDLMTLRKRIGHTCDRFSEQNGLERKEFREGFWTVACRGLGSGVVGGVGFWMFAEQQLAAKVSKDLETQAMRAASVETTFAAPRIKYEEGLVFSAPTIKTEGSPEPEAKPDFAVTDVERTGTASNDFGGLLESAAEYLNTNSQPNSPDDSMDEDNSPDTNAQPGFLESAAAYLDTSPPPQVKRKYDPAAIIAKANQRPGRKPKYVVTDPVYEHSMPRQTYHIRYGKELGEQSSQRTQEQVERWRSARGVD